MRQVVIKKSAFLSLVALGLSTGGDAQAGEGRDNVSIVGSSTVYAFSAAVAEQLGRVGKFKTPNVESTGTGGGFKLFCSGVGAQFPDIANASRAIKKSEVDECKRNGVTDIAEVKIGFDGIVLAYSKESKADFALARKDIFLALAKRVPDPKAPESETLIENPYNAWNEVNLGLPKVKIEVFGPPPTSGTRDAFGELALERGAEGSAWLNPKKATGREFFKVVSRPLRQDGAFIEVEEDDSLALQKLRANPQALGIVHYSVLRKNRDTLKASRVDGEIPSFENIADGKYPLSRPLYFYV
jgi:phosphate transport system substrate-binding protein